MKVETPARETLPRHKRPFSFGQVIVLFLLITAAGPFAVTLCSVTILLFAFSHPKEYQMRHAPPGIVDPLKDIMYGLGYPAVLGTGLVFLALHIAKLPNGVWAIDDPVSCLAIAAGSFYTLSFTALSETEEEKTKLSYRWPAFIVDVFEVGLMFCCFYFLGLMEGKDAAPNYPIVYGTLIVDVIIVQPVWRLVAGIKVSAYLVDRVVATTILLVGGCFSKISPTRHLWIHSLVAVSLVTFVGEYIYRATEFQIGQLKATVDGVQSHKNLGK